MKRSVSKIKHKLLIAGGRDFNNYSLLEQNINSNNIECIISGCAKGADTLAIKYGINHNIPIEKYPAQWDLYGKSAGYIRNKIMVDKATAIICFWDGHSKGTKNTIELAKKTKKILKIVYY